MESEFYCNSHRRPNDPNRYDIETESKLLYEGAQVAVDALMAFLANLFPGQQPLCVTYFDEAHELEMRFWILLRVLSHQHLKTMMWYVFMGTKLSISYFAPTPGNCMSLNFACALVSH